MKKLHRSCAKVCPLVVPVGACVWHAVRGVCPGSAHVGVHLWCAGAARALEREKERPWLFSWIAPVVAVSPTMSLGGVWDACAQFIPLMVGSRGE